MLKYKTIYEYDYSKFKKLKSVKRNRGRQNNKKEYVDTFLTFDIETTRIEDIEQSFMYIWQCYDGSDVIIGRTWDEWFDFLLNIKKYIDDKYVVIYVHNLSFEFHYLSGIYKFDNNEVFATEPRKILKCEMFDSFEFRCSLYLTNMNLRKYLQTYNVDNKKGEMDYSIKRFPWTRLSDDDLEYCINDVVGLHQALQKELIYRNCNLYTIPLTLTGFPRKDVKRQMQKFNHKQLQDLQPNVEIYQLLRDAFRGGNTHANRYYVNEILENVKSYDRISSYPDVMLNHDYPMKKFQITKINDIERVIELMSRNKALLIEIVFENITLKNKMFGSPYLSQNKCRNIKNAIIDNGRILSADYLETTITDIDLKIILDIYKFDKSFVIKCAYSNYKKLPDMFRNVIIKYYQNKTKLKRGDKILYAIAKSLLNSLYGMSVQDIGKQSILYDDGEFNEDIKTIDELLNKNRKKAYLFYAWGVWISAWARFELHRAIMMCGDKLVYHDTDSVKFIGNVNFKKYNDEQIDKSKLNDAYASDDQGNIYYMGVYELDGEYKQFKTMGAKKYAYIDYNDELHVTISGVNRKDGAIELSKYGGLNAMQEGFIFYDSGGNEAIYNDEDFGNYKIDGKYIYISKNITIKKSTYTLGLTSDYQRLLNYCKKLKYNPKGYKGV